jgi:uncharacterized membrane protein YfcA
VLAVDASSVGALLAAAVSVLVGAAVQGAIGIGLGLVAIPVLALVAPETLPHVIVLASLPLMGAMVWHERQEFELGTMRWLVTGRLLGALPAFAVLAAVSDRVLQLFIGVSTLVFVGLMSTRRVRIPITRSTQFAAGAVSGFTGTATGVGGPTIALLYSHHRAATLRPTLALVMLIGSALSVVGYAVGGRYEPGDVGLAALLLVPIAAGLALGVRVRSRLQGPAFRATLLGAVSATAVALILQAV